MTSPLSMAFPVGVACASCHATGSDELRGYDGSGSFGNLTEPEYASGARPTGVPMARRVRLLRIPRYDALIPA